MRDSRKIIIMQWAVIAVLVIGGSIAGYMLVHKADDLSQTNDELTSDNASLHSQLDQSKTQPQASPTPAATASPSPSPSALPSAAPATPTPTLTPKPKG